MKIEKLTVQNWRSIKDAEISFDDLMILIGQNNCGKSNTLYSLLFFFGQIKLNDLDFNNKSEKLFVEVKFIDLDEHDKRQFKKYLNSDGSIIVRKVATKGGSDSYHGFIQNPNQEWLQEVNITKFTSRDKARDLPLYSLLPTSGRITKDQFLKAQKEFIAENPSSVKFTYELEIGLFMGLKSVAQGIFGELYFIPAVKAASDELNVKGNALFSRLYSSVIQKLSENNEQYKKAKKEVSDLVKKLNKLKDDGEKNEERPNELANLETRLQNQLSNWNASIEIEITPPNIDEIFRVGTNVWVNDGIKTDISRKGHGLQRSMIFALIKAYSQLLKDLREEEEKERVQNSELVASTKRTASKSTYFLLEEPELYLHPQAQRELFSSLQELSKSKNQVIIATHSSFFVDLNLYKSTCIIRKTNSEIGSIVIQNKTDIFTDFTDKQKFNMAYWINPERGELFFAEKVILLEGATDKTIIPFLAKKLNVYNHNYTIIDCGGKTSIPLYIRLLNSFQIKYVAVYDQDHQVGKNPVGIDSANKHSQKIEDEIDFRYGRSVILVNDIEEEIGMPSRTKGKPYLAIEKITEIGYALPESFSDKIKHIFN